ncbi:thymidine kinase, partial [bacterium]|nr:thymidine kinase [bacterium]
ILTHIDEIHNVIIIDEAQFFDEKIVDVCLTLVQQKKHLIIAGLDKNFRVEPFGPMPKLLAIADQITKLTAACNVCGNHASLTQRITKSDNEILIGDNDYYEARCYDHYD